MSRFAATLVHGQFIIWQLPLQVATPPFSQVTTHGVVAPVQSMLHVVPSSQVMSQPPALQSYLQVEP